MPQNFSKIETNLDGINQFLTTNGVKLSENDKQKLKSIFDAADGKFINENPNSKDGKLDEKEIQYFKENVEKELPSILNKLKGYFDNLTSPRNNMKIEKEHYVAPADATRVEINRPQVIEPKEIVAPQPIATPFTSNSNARAKKGVEYDGEVLNQALNNLLRNKNSKLKNTAMAFIASAQKDSLKNKLDPFVIIAISMLESGHGTSKLAQNKNNIGGLGGPGHWLKFNTVEDSIDCVARTINKRISEGYETIGSIGRSGRYCSEKKQQAGWIRDVTSFAESLRKEYNRLLVQKNGQS